MQKSTQKKEYDTAMRSKALTGLVLRVAVAGYLAYLGWKILSNMLDGGSAIPVGAVWVICAVFAAVAVGFCVYAWKSFRKALKAAELSVGPQACPADIAAEKELSGDGEDTGDEG